MTQEIIYAVNLYGTFRYFSKSFDDCEMYGLFEIDPMYEDNDEYQSAEFTVEEIILDSDESSKTTAAYDIIFNHNNEVIYINKELY